MSVLYALSRTTFASVMSAAARTASRLSRASSSCARHVARMLGVAVGVHRVLSAADELPPVSLDELGLVESQA